MCVYLVYPVPRGCASVGVRWTMRTSPRHLMGPRGPCFLFSVFSLLPTYSRGSGPPLTETSNPDGPGRRLDDERCDTSALREGVGVLAHILLDVAAARAVVHTEG